MTFDLYQKCIYQQICFCAPFFFFFFLLCCYYSLLVHTLPPSHSFLSPQPNICTDAFFSYSNRPQRRFIYRWAGLKFYLKMYENQKKKNLLTQIQKTASTLRYCKRILKWMPSSWLFFISLLATRMNHIFDLLSFANLTIILGFFDLLEICLKINHHFEKKKPVVLIKF